MLNVIVGAAATWRLSHMFIFENGPFKVFRRIRKRFGVVYYPDPNGEESDEVAEARYEITICIWCLSVWVGTAVTLLQRFLPKSAHWLLLPFVYSAFAATWNKVLEGANRAKRT